MMNESETWYLKSLFTKIWTYLEQSGKNLLWSTQSEPRQKHAQKIASQNIANWYLYKDV